MPPVTFRVEVNYVEVDVVVTDKAGNLVKGLTADDFEVLEDKKPQKIDLFTTVDIPIERAERVLLDRPPIDPDVRINDRFEGRMFVVVLDDLHTHSMRSLLVRKAAKQFIQQNLGANDLAAVVYTGGRVDAGQDFTSSKRLLAASVDRFMGQKLRSKTLDRLDEYNQLRRLGLPPQTRGDVRDPNDQQRAYNARVALDTLGQVATYMQGIRGRRKAVLFFSEGIDYDITNVFENREATAVMDYTRDAIGAATRSNVAFYTIDPRGLTTLADEGMEMSAPPEDPSFGIGVTSLQDELRQSQDSLRTLAEETGGFAVVNTNEFAGSFDKLIRETSTYYVLGYYPSNQKRDGRFRDIKVRVTRPDLEVSARKGYVAPKSKTDRKAAEAAAGTSAVLRDALNSPIPEPGLPMAVQAAAFKGTAPNASVAVVTQFGGRAMKFTESGGVYRNTIELSMLAIDAGGKVAKGDRNTAELKLSPQTFQAVENAGFRLVSRLDLKPGRYTLRVAATESGGGLVGSVVYDLEVPEFSKDALAMSGLVLTSSAAAMTPTARPDEQLKEVLPAPPTIVRDFFQPETLSLFAEVYDNEAAKPHRVDISTLLMAEDGRTVFKTADERSSDELKGAKGGYGYTAQVPLKDIAPGAYVLRVEARSRLDSDKPVVRETQIRVREIPRATPAAAAPAKPGRTIVPVDRGPQSGVHEYREVVARTIEEWTALWGTLPARRPMPKVTFESTMIAALFAGARPTPGYTVEITGVKIDGEALVIEYVERVPAPDTVTAQMITTPYIVAGVPLHAGPVRFVKVEPASQP
jgi:VWFA-related protein